MIRLETITTLITSIAISFIVTYITVPIFNKYMQAAGIMGTDIMKKNGNPVADMGGPGVITGLLSGIFFYIAISILFPPRIPGLVYILASLNTILIISPIGIFDVLTSLMKQREGSGIFEKIKRRGIPGWLYFFLPLPAAVPLTAVNAGISKMTLPFIGRIELGIIYPLVIIPIAVICCSNATNFLAGFNGLEAGMGFIAHIFLGLYAYLNDQMPAAAIAFVFAAALLAFLKYNWYPALVFPGDLNYTIGAVYASVTIIGNLEKFAVLCFIPWILEAILKALSKFKAESYGILQEDGTVKPRKNEIRGLTHIVMKLKSFKEYQVTQILILFELIVCVVAFIVVKFI
jgi:UDP-N-acetylglucosamine--dolichyl-phosphate N-acetylglucosaminephosphotransferase